MAVLSTKARKNLPASKFAGPDRSYPVENKAHAANAKARAAQQFAEKHLSQAQLDAIDAAANKVLNEGKKQPAKHS